MSDSRSIVLYEGDDGLSLIVYVRGKPVYYAVYPALPYAVRDLVVTIRAYFNGEDPRDWDGNLLDDEAYVEDIELVRSHPCFRLVLDDYWIADPDRDCMGYAAKLFHSIYKEV